MSNKLKAHLSVNQPFHGDCTWEGYLDIEGNPVCSSLDERGREIPDSTPLEPPLGYREGPSLADTVHRIIRTEMSRIAEDEGFETFEEADDFDVEDDPADPHTPYEAVFDPPVPVEQGQQGEGGTPSKTSVAPTPASPEASPAAGGTNAPGSPTE